MSTPVRDRVTDYPEPGQTINEVHHHHYPDSTENGNGKVSARLWTIVLGVAGFLLVTCVGLLGITVSKVYDLSERMARMETAFVLLTDDGKLKP